VRESFSIEDRVHPRRRADGASSRIRKVSIGKASRGSLRGIKDESSGIAG